MQLQMRKTYLVKTVCSATAYFIVARGYVCDMTEIQIEQEIYAHAVFYYSAIKWKHDTRLKQYIIKHADPIDLQDGGDTIFRRICYHLIWIFC